jgi:hypothetical protein
MLSRSNNSLPELLQHIGDRRFEGLGLSGEVVVEGAKPDIGLARARVNA